jgi:hypothetical protein
MTLAFCCASPTFQWLLYLFVCAASTCIPINMCLLCHPSLLMSPAGFFLFVGLAFYFCTHPPTPLAVTAEHVEVLLHDLQQQVQQQLHSLHVGDNLQALGHGLSERVHALEHSLQDGVHALEHRLQDGVHKLEGRLSDSLADNLHQLQVRGVCSRACLDFCMALCVMVVANPAKFRGISLVC